MTDVDRAVRRFLADEMPPVERPSRLGVLGDGAAPAPVLRVLLLEDSADDAAIAQESLGESEEIAFSLTHVTTLAAARERLSREPFDAAVIDLNVPDSAGVATVRAVREVAPALPVIVLTGERDPDTRREAIRAGALDCIVKGAPPLSHLVRSIRFALERNRVEEQRRQLQRIIASNPDAVIVTDRDGTIQFANDTALALFERTREQLFQERFLFSGNDGASSTVQLPGANGTRTVEVWAVPIDWNDAPATLATFRDVTESRRLTEQLVQAQKMESVGHLAGGVAHDFNNLVTVILAYATFAREALPEGDARREDLAQVLSAADRARSLISQLLAFARRQPSMPRSVAIGELLGSVQRLLARTLPESIQLRVHGDDGIWPVRIDPGQLEQVVMNLAVNARDAMPQGGRIDIHLANLTRASDEDGLAAGDYVGLDIQDTGTGIPPEVISRIWEPFFTTKDQARGTGLGLASCYGIVKQAGGDITVTSTVGEGTTFHLLLPRAFETPEARTPTPAEPLVLNGHETILLVEDDAGLRRLMIRMLRHHGYQVFGASDGEEALRTIDGYDGTIDLVVSDLVMPRMGGAALAATLRRLHPTIQLLCTTGYSASGDSPSAVPPGATILYKPFRQSDLLRAVRRLLDGEREQGET